MKEPRNLNEYSPAADIAEMLENLAKDVRSWAEIRPMMRVNVSLQFWNPAWKKPTGGVARERLDLKPKPQKVAL